MSELDKKEESSKNFNTPSCNLTPHKANFTFSSTWNKETSNTRIPTVVTRLLDTALNTSWVYVLSEGGHSDDRGGGEEAKEHHQDQHRQHHELYHLLI